MSDTIKRFESRLTDIYEPDFGLLDELLGLGALTDRQYNNIRSERTVNRRTDALLDLLTSQEQCNKFMTALRRTQQEHVVNYITENGGQAHTIQSYAMFWIEYCAM